MMQRSLLGFALVCAAILFACPKPSPSGGDGSTPPDGVADPSAGGAAGGGDDGAQSSPTSCLSDADCNGGVCEGQGCGDDQPGTCAAADRICTRDSQTYCGCDGQTFHSSGSCPGQRYASKGECAAPSGGGGDGSEAQAAADGSPCRTGSDCQSGICEGEGCGDDQLGACMSAARPCTRDFKPYCGCDGQVFRGSGSCPGRRFARRGEC